MTIDTSLDEIGAFDLPSFCHAYKISRSLAYKEIRAGRLRVMKIGTLTRITKDAAREWQQSRVLATRAA